MYKIAIILIPKGVNVINIVISPKTLGNILIDIKCIYIHIIKMETLLFLCVLELLFYFYLFAMCDCIIIYLQCVIVLLFQHCNYSFYGDFSTSPLYALWKKQSESLYNKYSNMILDIYFAIIRQMLKQCNHTKNNKHN